MPANFTGSLAISGSLLLTGSIITTGGITISGSIASASFASTASFVTLSQTASFVANAQSASFAATASSADDFLARGTITAQTLVVQTITSSVDFVTGSTRFGSFVTDTHQFTGSVRITGSLSVTGSGINVSSSVTIGRSTINIADYTVPIASNSLIFRGNYWNSATGNKEITVGEIYGSPTSSNIPSDPGTRMIVKAGSTDVATFTSAGNVGIGTTAPAYKLDVSGTGNFTGALSGTSATFSSTINSGAVTITAGGDHLILVRNTFNTFQFGTGTTSGINGLVVSDVTAGTVPFIITQNTGAAKFSSSVTATSLALNGSIANSGDAGTLTIKQSSTTYTNGIYLERGGERNGYYMYIGGSVDSLTFRRNYFGTQSDVMSLTRDGNVGIGVTDVKEKFEVAANWGNLRLYGRGGIRLNNLSNNLYYNGSAWVRDNASYGAQSITFDTNGTIIFENSSATSGDATERMRITSGGNLKLNAKTISSFTSNPGNVAASGTTTLTITQVAGEFQSTYLVAINGLYTSGGANQNGYLTGLVNFFTDGSVAQANATSLQGNGWQISASATTGGTFTITFTNSASTTMSNIAIRALKINVTGGD